MRTQLSITNWANIVDYFYSQTLLSVQGSPPINQTIFTTHRGNDIKWLPYTDDPYNQH